MLQQFCLIKELQDITIIIFFIIIPFYQIPPVMDSTSKLIQTIIQQSYQQESQRLDLNHVGQEMQWFKVLESRDWLSLKDLSLTNCQITDDSIGALVKKNWPNLLNLHLWSNKLKSMGVKQLTLNPWPQLQLIQLGKNDIGMNGAKWLVKINLPLIKQIYLGGCNIGNEGAKHLIKGAWPQLKELFQLDGYLAFGQANWSKLKWIELCKRNYVIHRLYNDPISMLGSFSMQPRCGIDLRITNQDHQSDFEGILEQRLGGSNDQDDNDY